MNGNPVVGGIAVLIWALLLIAGIFLIATDISKVIGAILLLIAAGALIAYRIYRHGVVQRYDNANKRYG
jgi:hypothetical protein